MIEETLLARIVLKEGVEINSRRVEAIQVINYPWHKQEVQSFLGKINFLIRFIPNFAKIVKEITNMLKKETEINGLRQPGVPFNR